MVRPENGVMNELIASVRSNVEVARDAMKAPVNDDSHAIVSDLMLEIKQSQDQLQKTASELVESGRFDNTNEIFETIDLVTNLEPEFERWSKAQIQPSQVTPQPAGDLGADEPDQVDDDVKTKKKKKKKKSKREDADGWAAAPPATSTGGLAGWDSQPAATSSWDAFPAPPATVVGDSPPAAQEPLQPPPVTLPALVAMTPANTETPSVPIPRSARLTLGMTWETLGPLLGDPGSTDEVRKARLGDMIKEAIANECGITLDRIRIKAIS